MSQKRVLVLATVAWFSILASRVLADDLWDAMEADNARFLAAYNAPDPGAFLALYTQDAVLLPPGVEPVAGGPEAIKQFFEQGIKAGLTDHTFEIVSVHADGKYAYQVARWTIVLVKGTGERIPFSGNTIRIFERQSDGTWLTKVHMFNSHQR